MLKNKWEKLTAEKYDYYANKYPMYKRASRFLVRMANINKGMSVIDLACGTGVTTKEILKKIGSFGKIIGVDSSKEMLNIAKKKIKQRNISFIHSSAEEIDKIIKEKVDLVLCNSAFFIMDMNKTLKSIREILKDGGRFIFNLPDQYHKFPKRLKRDLPFPIMLKMIKRFIFNLPDQYHKFPKRLKRDLPFPIMLKMIMQKIVFEKYGLKPKKKKLEFFLEKSEIMPPDFKTINKILKSNSFKIDEYKTLKLKRTPRDLYEFLKIPLMTKGMFPTLGYLERMEILDKAYRQVNRSKEFEVKWIYFVTKKSGFPQDSL